MKCVYAKTDENLFNSKTAFEETIIGLKIYFSEVDTSNLKDISILDYLSVGSDKVTLQ